MLLPSGDQRASGAGCLRSVTFLIGRIDAAANRPEMALLAGAGVGRAVDVDDGGAVGTGEAVDVGIGSISGLLSREIRLLHRLVWEGRDRVSTAEVPSWQQPVRGTPEVLG